MVKKRMKVATKLVLGFLIIYLLFGSAIFISMYESSKELKKIASEGLLALTRHTIEEIDKNIHERIYDIGVYSQDTELMGLAAQSNSEFEKLSDMQSYIN